MRAYYLPDSLLFYVLLMVAQTVKNPPAMQETWVQSLGREDPLEKEWQPTPVFIPGESHGQRSLEGHKGHRVIKSQTQPSDHQTQVSDIDHLVRT